MRLRRLSRGLSARPAVDGRGLGAGAAAAGRSTATCCSGRREGGAVFRAGAEPGLPRESCASSRSLPGWGPTASRRTVESELRLAWDPFAHSDDAPEARTLRQVLQVNGHEPRKNDTGTARRRSSRPPRPSRSRCCWPSSGRTTSSRSARPGKSTGVSRWSWTTARRPVKVAVSEVEGTGRLHQLRRGRRLPRADLARSRHPRGDAAGSVAGRAGRHPDAAHAWRGAPASMINWVMERMGHDHPLQAGDVQGSRRNADAAGLLVLAPHHARRGHASPAHLTEYSGYRRFLTGATGRAAGLIRGGAQGRMGDNLPVRMPTQPQTRVLRIDITGHDHPGVTHSLTTHSRRSRARASSTSARPSSTTRWRSACWSSSPTR